MDFKINYNYLPLSNSLLFNRSSKSIAKVIRYFDIGCVVFFDFGGKKFSFKNFQKYSCITAGLKSNFFKSRLDIDLDITNNPIICYIIYLFTLRIYLKNKN